LKFPDIILKSGRFLFHRRDLAVSCLPSMHYCPNNAWNWRNQSQKCRVDDAAVERVGHYRKEPEIETFTSTEKLNDDGRQRWMILRLLLNDRLYSIDPATVLQDQKDTLIQGTQCWSSV